MEFLWTAAAGLIGLAAGTLFSQRIKDWFSGVESDLRAKAVDAGKAVLAAAGAEEARIRDAARAAADKAVDAAKAAAGIGPGTSGPAPEAAPPATPAA